MITFKEFLKEDEESREAYLKLRQLNKWARKPTSWDEVQSSSYTVSENDLERMGIRVGMLPSYDGYDVLNINPDTEEVPGPLQDFSWTPKHDIFILQIPTDDRGDLTNFLIKREGADHARYAIHLA